MKRYLSQIFLSVFLFSGSNAFAAYPQSGILPLVGDHVTGAIGTGAVHALHGARDVAREAGDAVRGNPILGAPVAAGVLMYTLMTLMYGNPVDTVTIGGTLKRWIKGMSYRARYYLLGYAVPVSVAYGSTKFLAPRARLNGVAADAFGLGAAGLVGFVQFIYNLVKVSGIKNQYVVIPRKGDYSHRGDLKAQKLPVQMARWRQNYDEFGDGLYWADDKALLAEKRNIIKTVLRNDMYAGRLSITDPETGGLISEPTPAELINVIEHDIESLYKNERVLKAMQLERDVRHLEDVRPSKTKWRLLFWPNWNRTVRLSAELIQLMKRLDVLRSILIELRSEVACDKRNFGCDPWTKRNVVIAVNKNDGAGIGCAPVNVAQ